MKKLLNPLLVVIIITCVGVVIFKLKDNGYIKSATHTTCRITPMTTIYSDQNRLTAMHVVKRCNNTEQLKNVVLIKNKETKVSVEIYESQSDSPETIYLIWGEHDGLVIAKPEAGELAKEKRLQTKYRVAYLSLRELRVALGEALNDY